MAIPLLGAVGSLFGGGSGGGESSAGGGLLGGMPGLSSSSSASSEASNSGDFIINKTQENNTEMVGIAALVGVVVGFVIARLIR
ncbi:MAG: hypothetical protein JXR40_03895 [Pontiellaceae bacterium]|nr:hypothetical protein [Pontiellaceae bacterium]